MDLTVLATGSTWIVRSNPGFRGSRNCHICLVLYAQKTEFQSSFRFSQSDLPIRFESENSAEQRERGAERVWGINFCVLESERPYNRVRLVRSISSSGVGFSPFASHCDILTLSLSLCLCVCVRNKLMYWKENKLTW